MAHEESKQQDLKSHGEMRPNQQPNLKRYQDPGNGLQCEHGVQRRLGAELGQG